MTSSFNQSTSPPFPPHARLKLSARARVQTDKVSGKPVLVYPEGVLMLNPTGAAIVALCDGTKTAPAIVDDLSARFSAPKETVAAGVADFLARLKERNLIEVLSEEARACLTAPTPAPDPRPPAPAQFRPYGLLAEITYRCPLHCPYCSNTTRFPAVAGELAADEWRRVFAEAAELGVLHAGLSGGEPLQRADLAELVAAARKAGLYTNLITSAIGLTPARAEELKAAGLDSIQISFQADDEALADQIAGATAHAKKIEAAQLARKLGIALSANVVIHRANIGRLEQIIALMERLGTERLELANTQYYGWAFKNLQALLPTRAQLAEAEKIAAAAKARLLGKMEVLYVLPDYYGDRPKPCMNGWGRRFITVNAAGGVLPCPTAGDIPGLRFENVRQRALSWIWAESDSFNRFRGTEWMPEPCRSCDLREIDFGGCRCQAALLTGDSTVTDPACSLSPYRSAIERLVNESQESASPPFVYRTNPA